MNYALEHNYTVRNAVLDIETAEKQKWEATSFGLPQIDGTIDYQNWIKQAVTFIPAEIVGGPPASRELARLFLRSRSVARRDARPPSPGRRRWPQQRR